MIKQTTQNVLSAWDKHHLEREKMRQNRRQPVIKAIEDALHSNPEINPEELFKVISAELPLQVQIQVQIYSLDSFILFVNSYIPHLYIEGGAIKTRTIPAKGEILESVFAWRAESATGSIDELHNYLKKKYNCDFWAFNLGSLEDFLTGNNCQVLEVKTKIVFLPKQPENNNTKEKEDINEENECIICMNALRNVVLVGCGHYCMCITCANSMNDCPVCRHPYKKDQVIKVFST
uniref:RING-type domain-containing protein n=1 Tax=Arcella intermedia TaxID=1963864 RepID=A0A6B2LG64_9EUKA